MRAFLSRLSLLAALALPLGCAVADGPGVDSGAGYQAPPVQSAARFGLAPAYRPFYDALEGLGDWVLIEPFGWVFRPRVNFNSWQPYQQGWWEPSEIYGWVWLSSDDFGWITDHYGSWFYDGYQGWVWQPGPVWGPAWVAWVGVGDYVGWAPLAPADYDDYASAPRNMFTFARAQHFGTQHAGSQALFLTRVPDTRETMSEITRVDRVNGVSFNRGPDFATLQRLGAPVPAKPAEPDLQRVRLPELAPPGESDLLLRTRRLIAAGVRAIEAQRGGAAPAPAQAPDTTRAQSPGPRDTGAPADSIRTRPPGGLTPPWKHERPRRPGGPDRRPGAPPDTTRG